MNKNKYFLNENGYVCRILNNKISFRHIEIIESLIKRKKKFYEQVHHLNRIRNDNRESNLALVNKRLHYSYHRNLKRGIISCLRCGREGHEFFECNFFKNIYNKKIIWKNEHLNKYYEQFFNKKKENNLEK